MEYRDPLRIGRITGYATRASFLTNRVYIQLTYSATELPELLDIYPIKSDSPQSGQIFDRGNIMTLIYNGKSLNEPNFQTKSNHCYWSTEQQRLL